MDGQNRVVITGMSSITPHGVGLDPFWNSCKKGISSVKKIDFFRIPDSFSQIAGIAYDFLPETLVPTKSKPDRTVLLAFETIKQALIHAELDKNTTSLNYKKFSLYISSAVSQISTMEHKFDLETKSGQQRLQPDEKISENYNNFSFGDLSSRVAKKFGFLGGNVLIPTGCAGGVDAMICAIFSIRNGRSDVAITGAVEAPITPLVVAAFNKIGATSKKRNKDPHKASRPFDLDRDGFVLGEGCGILILESLEHALSRKAKIYAEVTGVGSVNNFKHMTDIPPDGAPIARACKLAIDDAGIVPDEVDFINAHGSSTVQNDIAETNAFYKVFGNRTQNIPVTSIKSQIGHPLSASNSIEVISSIMSLQENIIPPTINLHQQDPKCNLNVVANEAIDSKVNCILKTSSGFSGIHSSLIIERFNREKKRVK